MFKAIAIILIFTSCTMTGCYQSMQLNRRKHLLTEFRDFVQRLHTEMGYFKEPLPVILQKLHKGTDSPIDILLRQCLILMETSNVEMRTMWDSASKSAYEGEPLKTADLAVIARCGSFIGQSDFDGQEGHFALLKEELSRQIEDADRQLKTKGALYSKAGVSIGAVLAIALL